MESTVRDVALIFEGGGMRNSYSAGALTVMLENGLFFDDVYGLSAGATNAIDYLSRDVRRAEASFTASLDDLAFRWWIAPFAGADGVRAALHGHALARPGYALPFDFAAFQANPARAMSSPVLPPKRDRGTFQFISKSSLSYLCRYSFLICQVPYFPALSGYCWGSPLRVMALTRVLLFIR